MRAVRSKRCDDEQGSQVYCGVVRTSKIGSRQLAKASRWRCTDASMPPLILFLVTAVSAFLRLKATALLARRCHHPILRPQDASPHGWHAPGLGAGTSVAQAPTHQHLSLNRRGGTGCTDGAGLSVIVRRPRKPAGLIEFVRKNRTMRVLSKAETTLCVPVYN